MHKSMDSTISIVILIGLFQGYEVVGLEKLPENGPTLLILNHGRFPVDTPLFSSAILLKTGRSTTTIVDRNMEKIPGFQTLLEATELISGTVEDCVKIMENGDFLVIYPGGTKEAILGEDYELVWREKSGFAKIALQTNAVCFIYSYLF